MISRLAIALPVAALAFACAGVDPALKAELMDVRAQLRVIRDENARIANRLDRVEIDLAVKGAKGPGLHKAQPLPSAELAVVPSLTVVKLKPRSEPPPRLPTQTPIVEPPAEVMEALAANDDEPATVLTDKDAASPEDPAVVELAYEQGLSALRTGNVQGGVDRLRQFSHDHPKHPKADNALYFASVGQLGLGDLAGAAASLEAVLREYPAGDAVAESMLKLAECRTRQSRPKDAKSLYGEVIQRYPGTAAASQAEQKLAQLLRTP